MISIATTGKTERVNYKINSETRIVLEKLSKIQSRSMTSTLELIIMEKGKEYGLIEARNALL